MVNVALEGCCFFAKTVGGFLKAPLKGVSVPELVPFIFHCWEGGHIVNKKSCAMGWYKTLGGAFKYFLFSPLFGEDFHFDSYFSEGLKPPT